MWLGALDGVAAKETPNLFPPLTSVRAQPVFHITMNVEWYFFRVFHVRCS